MHVTEFLNNMFQSANDLLDVGFLWGGLILLFLYPLYLFFSKYKKTIKDRKGRELISQTLVAYMLVTVGTIIWLLPEAIWIFILWFFGLPYNYFEYLNAWAWLLSTWRLLIIFSLFTSFAYQLGHEYGKDRWKKSIFIFFIAIAIGWIIHRWMGILFVSLPFLTMYFAMLRDIALVIIPASDPDNHEEQHKRARVFMSYTWGTQAPVYMVEDFTMKEQEPRIAGDVTWDFLDFPVPGFGKLMQRPGMIWTRSHQVVAISKSTQFKRVDGPGAVFTSKLERLYQAFDLRVQLRNGEIDVVSKDGVRFIVRFFTAFRLDNTNWDRDTYLQLLRMNPQLHGANKLSHINGSFPYSRLRIQTTLGVTSNTAFAGDSPTLWDQWALNLIENQIRKVISQKNLNELWLPANDRGFENGLEIIAREILDGARLRLRAAGVLLFSARVTDFHIPTSQNADQIGADESPDITQGHFEDFTKSQFSINSDDDQNPKNLDEYFRSLPTHRENKSTTFSFPEDPAKWQSAYTREKAHRDSVNNAKCSNLAFLMSVIITSAFLAISTTQYIDIASFDWRLSYVIAMVLTGTIAILFTLANTTALKFASEFLVEFYRKPKDKNITKLIRYRLNGVPKLPPPLNVLIDFERIIISNGEIDNADNWPAWSARNLGGPLSLVIYDGSALYLERGNRFSRIVGPGDGNDIPFLEQYETVKSVVDLRPKAKEGTFDTWTKDGIKIRFVVQINCRIGDPQSHDPSLGRIYSFDPIAIKNAIERQSIREDNGILSEFTWIDAAWGQVTSVLPSYIGSRFLNDLLVEGQSNSQIISLNFIPEILIRINHVSNRFGVYVLELRILKYEILTPLLLQMEEIGNTLQSATSLKDISNIAEKMSFVPDELRKEFESLIGGVEQVAKHALAALDSDVPYNKQEQLRNAFNKIKSIRQSIAIIKKKTFASQWDNALIIWEKVFETELKELKGKAGILNVYAPGAPVNAGNKVFKGRQDLFITLEGDLTAAAEHLPAILLHGARRTGKTSVIKQLPIRLGPLVIPVDIDLQSATMAESAYGVLTGLGLSIHKSCASRHVVIPELQSVEEDPYRLFLSWIGQIETLIGDHRILLAFDEYEKIEGMIKEKRLDERILSLLRVLIQHHPKFILLFSGAHTLEDMPALWSDYLINVKMLKVGPLKEEDARELIVSPVPEFALQYDNDAVERIISATNCQPYLIQLTCQELINQLNEVRRTHATVADVETALLTSIDRGGFYFDDLFRGYDSDDEQRIILKVLAQTEPLSFVQLQRETALSELALKKSLQHLVNRDVLKQYKDNYQFQIELVRRWVQGKI